MYKTLFSDGFLCYASFFDNHFRALYMFEWVCVSRSTSQCSRGPLYILFSLGGGARVERGKGGGNRRKVCYLIPNLLMGYPKIILGIFFMS